MSVFCFFLNHLSEAIFFNQGPLYSGRVNDFEYLWTKRTEYDPNLRAWVAPESRILEHAEQLVAWINRMVEIHGDHVFLTKEEHWNRHRHLWDV